MEPYQSGYREHFSTETVLLKVKSDILEAINKKEIMCLIMLDLSAAFDSLEHSLILTRLKYQFGITDTCLEWFADYFTGRNQRVIVTDSNGVHAESTKRVLRQGIPQGSVLGPIIFNLFLSPLGEICHKHGISFVGYADDSQNYLSFRPIKDDITPQKACTDCLETCLKEVRQWMKFNFLKLNDSKTEFIIFGVHQQLAKVQHISIKIGDDIIENVPAVCNLGMHFDSELKHTVHINKLASSSFATLQNVARIRNHLDVPITKTIVQVLVISRLDYCNSLLLGIPKYNIDKLQRIQNMACRIIYKLPKYSHITPFLFDAHWLKIPQRIDLKILTLMYKCIHQLAPPYLMELVIDEKPIEETRILRSSSSGHLKTSISRISFVHNCAFQSQGPRKWNSLDIDIRNASNIMVFKSKLKTHLFRQCYSSLI